MDMSEEKYTPPEHLSDPLMATKFDIDDLKTSNYLPEKKYYPTEEKFDLSDVCDENTLDDNLLIIDEENTADSSNQIQQIQEDPDDPQEIKKTAEKQEDSKEYCFPEDTDQPEKPIKLDLVSDICNSKFANVKRLEVHMTTKHQGLKVCKCKICGKGFTRFTSLKGHMGTQHGAKRQFPCLEPGCKKHYETEEGLQNHMKSWHDPENPRITEDLFVCEVCGKVFKTFRYLTQHSYTHGIPKPFACEKCQRRFLTKTRLRLHKNCGLKKIEAHEEKSHMNIQTKERTWPCKFCSKVFSYSEGLSGHVKIVHRGIRNYHCPICERSFGKPQALKLHVMTHTGEKPHACEECGKRFIQKTSLKTHMKTHLKYNKGDNTKMM